MKRIINITKSMLRNWVRSRSGVFFSVLFPVMLLIIFASIFGGDSGSEYILYVQNLDINKNMEESNLSNTFIDIMNKTGAFDLVIVPAEEEPRNYVDEQIGSLGGTFRLLIIPLGFQDNLLNSSVQARLSIINTTARMFIEQAGPMLPIEQRIGIEESLVQLEEAMTPKASRNVQLIYISDPSNSGSSIVLSIIDNLARSFNYGLIGVESNIEFYTESVVERSFNAIDYYVPGLIGAFIMTNGIIGVTTNTTEFKRRGILKRFATTPLSRIEWVIGNVLTQTILSFILVGVMMSVAWVGFGLTAIPNIMSIILIIIGAIMFSGIGLMLAGVVTDVEAASAAGNAIAFPMMFLSGSFFPLEVMPDYLRSVSSILPLTYFSEGLRSALIYENMQSTLNNLTIITVLGIGFIILGSLITRWKEK